MDLQSTIKQRLGAALGAAFGDALAQMDPLVRPTSDPRYGDIQANVAMGLAKELKMPPREVAQRIIEHLEQDGVFAAAVVAGPGFINLTLDTTLIEQIASAMCSHPRLGVSSAEPTETVLVDYSAPNVAKEMHVGHLRSTIIGDAIVRILEFLGHRVVRQNHIGDWGTQFGMLIEHLLDQGFDAKNGSSPEVLTRLYQAAKQRFDNEPKFADRSRQRVVNLQSGDSQTKVVWQSLVQQSTAYFDSIYRRLDVRLHPDDTRGESFYNPMLPKVVQRLKREGHLQASDGAQVVYPEGFVDREGNPLGMIVQKSDGGYLYATTDIAAAMFRIDQMGSRRLIYVIGLPQRQHFEMFTTVLRQFSWIDQQVRMDFVGFGSVLGRDRKMFKTRSGETIRLEALIDEAEQRALGVIQEKGTVSDPQEQQHIARVVGVGAMKYADLSSDRIKDYVFDWDRMLSLDGNTAPYLQNAYVRIQSIFRKGGIDPDGGSKAAIRIREFPERELALHVLQFPEVVTSVADSLEPHRLCGYLYELATSMHRFYEQCPVLGAEDDQTRQSRVGLCGLVSRTLRTGLDLLGIGVVERM